MPVPKGTRIGGRQKGTPNHATTNAREAIARFIDGNAHRLQAWLDEIACGENGAEAAMRCFRELLEYHVPKLGRVELTGKDGGPLEVSVVRFSDPAQQVDATTVSDARLAGPGTGVPPRGLVPSPSRWQG